MNLHWMNTLIQRTLRNENELNDLRFAGLAAFMVALAQLTAAGMTAAQLQWFIGVPFRHFGVNERFKVMLLARALERGTDCVENWQQQLFNEEFWQRLHGDSQFFTPDPLPDPVAICRDAGFPPERAPVAFAAPSVTRAAVIHLPVLF